MSKRRKKHKQKPRNFVHKHMHEFNKPKVEQDKRRKPERHKHHDIPELN